MPSAQHPHRGSQGWYTPPLLLPLSLLFLHLLPGPGLAHMHIPPEYHITNLKQPPVITAQPMSYTAFSADDITLTCEASGNPPPTFRWLMDGKQFDPTEDPWLNTSKSSGNFSVVSGKVPIHQYNGKYRCYASNELGTAVSEEVQIITENTPSLPKELKVKKTVQEGESVILKCDPPPSTVPPIIHWMDKNLQHIVQSDRVTKGLDGSLYFSHVLSNDSRDDYTCHAYYISARNILPKEPITLIVTPSNSVVHSRKPKFLQPSNGHSTHRALRGQRLVLECIPQGLPTPSVVWERKDELLSQSRVSRLNFDRWLQFENISESDDGEYQCTAINSQGVAKHTFTITVEAAPYWTRKPESKLYAPGETLQLHCKAEGIPTPTITWSLNGNAISGVDPDTRRSVHAGTLTLKDVTVSDTAVYQCEATNTHGSILVNTYVYVIELPAQILTKDELLYRVTQGQTAFLNCKTFGSPTPKLLWESEHMDSVLSNPRVFLRANGTLEITNASQEDAGHYTCSVLNSNQSIRAVLEVLNRTVILTRPEHLRVQRGQTAILHCHASVDPQLGLPLVLWRKDVQKLSSTMDKYKFNGSSLIVTNVQSKDKGVYTCEVSTNLDMANANGSITVVDRPDPPTHLLLSEKQARKLTLSWTPGDDHNSPINEFVVESEELKHGKGQWMNITQVPGETKRVEVLLQPYCTYHFRVIAFNEFGASDRSLPSKLHEVAPAAPDKNPEDVRSESTDPDKLVITWKEMDKQSFNGPGFQYKVMWRPSAGQGPHWNHKLVDSPPHIVRGTGTFTPFEIKVQSVNQLGLGPAPNTTIGHSGEDLPLESPQEVQVEQTNNTAFLVKWVAVDRKKVQGKLLGYKIHLGWLGPRGSHVERERESRVLVAWGENKVEEVLPDLRLFSRYNLAIAAFNSKGEGPRSELRSFETPEGVPSPPASLEFESPSKTELVLHWSPPEHPNGALTGYVLQYQIVDSNQSLMQEIDDPNASHITLGPLDPHSRYRFYLSGRTDAGQGDAIVKEGATLLDGDPPSNFSMFVGENNVNLSWVSGERYRNVVFHIRYLKKNAGGQWEVSEGINSTQSFYQLQGLLPGSKYNLEFMFNNSAYMVKEIKTEGPGISEVEMGFATQGWFIGLISAIVLLLLVLLILCFIKRSKGGKYSVKDKEEGQVDSEARPMKDETFGEYSENEEKRSISQPSLCVESKLGSDDSLAGYGDSVDIQFNEDGSFIGQYSGHRDGPGPGGPDSSGATSPVNPTVIPPIHPGIPNSVTGILDRGI